MAVSAPANEKAGGGILSARSTLGVLNVPVLGVSDVLGPTLGVPNGGKQS